MKRLIILPALAVALTAGAQAYIETNFSKGIPSDFTLQNADGCAWAEGIYANLGNNDEAAWVAGSLPMKGRAALSPTRGSDPSKAQDNLMILPATAIEHSGAVIRWDARSLHHHLPEAYEVLVRRSQDSAWQTLFATDAEAYEWTTHVVKLEEYAGETVELAFRACTRQGFILAVDNIFVGRPESTDLEFINRSKHFTACGEPAEICGTLVNNGAPASDLHIYLKGFGADRLLTVPALGTGEETELSWTVETEMDAEYFYTVDASGPSGALAADFMRCSAFERTNVLDRCSGTWCNNCPSMGLTTNRLQHLYGDQLIVVETHINDRLACRPYNADWIDENVFNIPALIPNHELSLITYKVADKDDIMGLLPLETHALVTATASELSDSKVSINAEVRFAEQTDNSDDRYRFAYVLLGDFHDPDKLSYTQSNMAMNFSFGEWYYQPDQVKPEMMYYDNVPVSGPEPYTGVEGSLPQSLAAGETYSHSYELSAEGFSGTALRALAMVVDTRTGSVMNACLAELGGSAGIAAPGTEPGTGLGDPENCTPEYYDLTGRKLTAPAGFCIERRGTTAKVILNSKN